MVPRPEYKRVRKRILETLTLQPGKCFTILQLQQTVRRPYELISEVVEYLVKAKEVNKHALGGFCVGEPVLEEAYVAGDPEDDLSKDIRAVYKEELRKGRPELPNVE